MRFSSILLMSAIVLTAATALAIPLAIRPAWVGQNSLSSEALNQSTPSEQPPSRKGGKRGGKILQQLNLTRDQFQQISTVRRKYQPLIRHQAQTVRTMQAEFRRLMAGSAEPAEVKAQFQQLQKHRQELQQFRFESSLAIRQILNPAQRKAFEAELDKQRAEKRDRP
jgi:periplasmic protein CpxP/Spy